MNTHLEVVEVNCSGLRKRQGPKWPVRIGRRICKVAAHVLEDVEGKARVGFERRGVLCPQPECSYEGRTKAEMHQGNGSSNAARMRASGSFGKPNCTMTFCMAARKVRYRKGDPSESWNNGASGS